VATKRKRKISAGRVKGSTVIADRTLHTTAGEQVRLALHQPVLDERGDWVCRAVVQRNGTTVTERAGHGVDSLQALVQGIKALRFSLGDEIANLTWLGVRAAVGLPFMIEDLDPDFVTLIKHLVEAEHCRLQIAANRHRNTIKTPLTMKRRAPSKRRRSSSAKVSST
jgi:hypothetical protein